MKSTCFFHASAAAIIHDGDGKVLVFLRKANKKQLIPDNWQFPRAK
jgi:8-oxo-dGTP pyrophosphatase MutT (NUDIX family)